MMERMRKTRMMTTCHLLRTPAGGNRQRSPKQRKKSDVTSSKEIDKPP
jgi:hypothetical protein